MFVNLKNGHVDIKSFRDSSATVTDLEDMLKALENETGEHLVISMEGVKDALEDGSFIESINADQDAVEYLHSYLSEK